MITANLESTMRTRNCRRKGWDRTLAWSEFLRRWSLALALLLPSIATAQSTLTGTWELRPAPAPRHSVRMEMRQSGTGVEAWGRDWRGTGKLNGTRGYYDWSFDDGKTGRTTFTYDPEFDLLEGSVRGDLSWDFKATRHRADRYQDVSGTWACNAGMLLIVEQIDSSLRAYLDRPGGAAADLTGYVSGSAARFQLRGHAGNFGVSDLYRSTDGRSLRGWLWWTEPVDAVETPTCRRVDRGGTPTPSPTWIGNISGKQECFSGGRPRTAGLSCGVPGTPGGSGLCLDPRTQGLIDVWLSSTRPRNGDRYDCYGRIVQISPNLGARTHDNCMRPDTDGRTRCEFLLHFMGDGTSPELGGVSLRNWVLRHLAQ